MHSRASSGRLPANRSGIVGRRLPSLREWPWASILTLTAGLVGVVVRVRQFSSGRSLWMDEASITLNILDRSAGQLLRPLGLFQVAPAGWLLAEKGTVDVFGDSEQALRLVALISGFIVIGLTWDVARRVGGPWCAALATVLVAVSPALIRYSSEVKQYSTDAACVLLVIDAALHLVNHKQSRITFLRTIRCAIGFGVAAFSSQAAVLLALAIIPIVAFCLLRARRWWHAVVAVALAASGVAAQYVTTIQPVADSEPHKAALPWYYPLLPSEPVIDRLRWLPGALWRLALDPFHAAIPPLLGAACVLGFVACWSRRRRAAVLLVCPVLVACVAALDYRYPFGGRLALGWVAPTLVLCCAPLAWQSLHARQRSWAAWTALTLTTGMLGSQIPTTARLVASPQTVTELRPVLAQVQRLRLPGEAVLPYSGADGQYVYYARRLDLPTTGHSISDFAGICPDIGLMNLLSTGGRFWFVYTTLNAEIAPGNLQPGDTGTAQDIDRIIARFTSNGHISRRITGDHAGAVEIVMSFAPYRTPPAEK